MQTHSDPLANITDIAGLVAEHPVITEPSVRWAISNRKTNGLAETGAVFKSGKKWLIDIALYVGWLRSKG